MIRQSSQERSTTLRLVLREHPVILPKFKVLDRNCDNLCPAQSAADQYSQDCSVAHRAELRTGRRCKELPLAL
jgi:hypothetical protein